MAGRLRKGASQYHVPNTLQHLTGGFICANNYLSSPSTLSSAPGRSRARPGIRSNDGLKRLERAQRPAYSRTLAALGLSRCADVTWLREVLAGSVALSSGGIMTLSCRQRRGDFFHGVEAD